MTQTKVKNCYTCGKELIEGSTIKRDWNKPLCTDCREVLLNYHLNKEKIDRVMRWRVMNK
jgi:hypothetical protein